jgi:hypothetical protein
VTFLKRCNSIVYASQSLSLCERTNGRQALSTIFFMAALSTKHLFFETIRDRFGIKPAGLLFASWISVSLTLVASSQRRREAARSRRKLPFGAARPTVHIERGRFHPHPSAKEQAEERAALVDLDRIMTRIRAAEAKLALVKEGRQPPIG